MPRQPRGVVYLLRDNGNVVRGNALAFALRERGFGTAICDLLTPAERERARVHRRSPIGTALLARRLLAVVDEAGDSFDCSAGIAVSGIAASAALCVAGLRPLAFDAVACRHANFLLTPRLGYVHAATLFIAVAGDMARIRPMTRAFQQLPGPKHFEILPAGSESFDDERSFRVACDLTAAWMRRHVHSTNVSKAIAAIPPEINAV